MGRRYRDFRLDRAPYGGDRAPVVGASLLSTPFFTLRQFRIATGRDRPSILLVPPLSGHFPVMLRDMVLGLLPDFTVAVLDWADVRHVPEAHGPFGFADNIRAIREAIRRIGPEGSVVAVCQAGVPALAAVADLAAWHPGSAPAHLVLLGAPIDPLGNPTPVVGLIRSLNAAWYRTIPISRVGSAAAGRGRLVYPAERQLQGLRRYLARHIATRGELARKMRRDDGAEPERMPFAELYSTLMDIDARHFARNIETVFLRRDLPRGSLTLRDRPIRTDAIDRTSLLVIEGELDDIAAPGQTSAALALCPAAPRRGPGAVVIPGCGHFGLFHGETWRGRVLPLLRAHCLEPGPGG